MPKFDQYGEFFEKYDPYTPQAPQYNSRKRPKKRKRNRYLRLALFLTPYILGAVAIVVTISLIISVFVKNPDTQDGLYMTAGTESTVSTEIVDNFVALSPVATEQTISLGSKIDSANAVLIDCSTGNILAQKSSTAKIYPASMTKVMSLLVAAEHVQNLDDTFVMTSAIIDPLYRQGSTLAGFMPNEPVRLKDMFYGAILESGGEAVVGLAIYVAGSEQAFVDKMNQKASELGLKNTHFSNASGLHDKDHYTTSREMAIIMHAALNNEFCREVLSTEYYTVPKNEYHEEIQFHSGMFTKMYGTEPEVATIKGGKTGYTAQAGNCLVSYAITDDGREIICVTAQGSGKYIPVYDCIELYKTYTH